MVREFSLVSFISSTILIFVAGFFLYDPKRFGGATFDNPLRAFLTVGMLVVVFLHLVLWRIIRKMPIYGEPVAKKTRLAIWICGPLLFIGVGLTLFELFQYLVSN